MVLHSVFVRGEHLQIIYPVVERITILVMYFFLERKEPTEVTLHEISCIEGATLRTIREHYPHVPPSGIDVEPLVNPTAFVWFHGSSIIITTASYPSSLKQAAAASAASLVQ